MTIDVISAGTVNCGPGDCEFRIGRRDLDFRRREHRLYGNAGRIVGRIDFFVIRCIPVGFYGVVVSRAGNHIFAVRAGGCRCAGELYDPAPLAVGRRLAVDEIPVCALDGIPVDPDFVICLCFDFYSRSIQEDGCCDRCALCAFRLISNRSDRIGVGGSVNDGGVGIGSGFPAFQGRNQGRRSVAVLAVNPIPGCIRDRIPGKTDFFEIFDLCRQHGNAKRQSRNADAAFFRNGVADRAVNGFGTVRLIGGFQVDGVIRIPEVQRLRIDHVAGGTGRLLNAVGFAGRFLQRFPIPRRVYVFVAGGKHLQPDPGHQQEYEQDRYKAFHNSPP